MIKSNDQESLVIIGLERGRNTLIKYSFCGNVVLCTVTLPSKRYTKGTQCTHASCIGNLASPSSSQGVPIVMRACVHMKAWTIENNYLPGFQAEDSLQPSSSSRYNKATGLGRVTNVEMASCPRIHITVDRPMPV